VRTLEADGVWIMGRHKMARRSPAVDVPSHGRVHWWTSARNRPQNSHFFSVLGPSGVIPMCRDSIRKSFHARQIGSDMEASQRAKLNVGRRPPKFSYRFSLIVHYLQSKLVKQNAASRDGRNCESATTNSPHHIASPLRGRPCPDAFCGLVEIALDGTQAGTTIPSWRRSC
jgi:hypothetical protein